MNVTDVRSAIGPYEIVERLGHGGMGVVYRARHHQSGQEVAVKTVRVPHERMLGSIRREIGALARLSHPGVVRIVDQGVHGGAPWYAMAYLRGQTLEYIGTGGVGGRVDPDADTELVSSTDTVALTGVARGEGGATDVLQVGDTLPLAEGEASPARRGMVQAAGGALPRVLGVLADLCETLAWIHGEGVVHGDLKPSNIIVVPSGVPVLVDFGLVTRFAGRQAREALEGRDAVMGTVDYMAPERHRGALVDARADLYALGCILFEALTGRPPFVGASIGARVEAHLSEAPPRPSALAEGVPEALDELVLDLLAKEPARRVGYAMSVVRALESLGAERRAEGWPTPRTYLFRSGVVGRAAELAEARRLVHRLASGQGGVALIGGESGVGKTRLAMEVAAEARRHHVRVLTGACPGGQAGALEGVRGALRAIADRCRERGREEADRLLGPRGRLLALYEPALAELPGQQAYPAPAELSPNAARWRLFRALAATLFALTEVEPVLLVIDDLHQADALTMGFVDYMSTPRRHRGLPLLIVATYRSEEAPDALVDLRREPALTTITLERLPAESVGEVAADMLASDPPEAFVRFLSERSGGNPFFMAEMLRAMVEEGLLRRDEGGQWRVRPGPAGEEVGVAELSALPMPASLQALLERRVAHLSEGGQALLNGAAVLGREFEVGLAGAVAQVEGAPLARAADELRRRALTEPSSSGRLRFAHGQLREVALQKMDAEALTRAHRRAAAALTPRMEAAPELAAAVASHHEAGGQPEAAMRRYLQAMRHARRQLNYEVAEASAMAWLRLAPADHPDRPRVRNVLGHKILHHLGRLQEARSQHEAALREARAMGDEVAAAHSLKSLAREMVLAGEYDDARRAVDEGQALARTHEAEGVVQDIEFMRGQMAYALGQYEDALAVLASVAGYFEGQGMTSRQANVMSVQVGVARAAGEIDRALELNAEVIDLLSDGDEPFLLGTTLVRRGLAQQDRGALETALRYFHEGLEEFRRVGDRRWEGVTLTNLADVCRGLGRLEEGLRWGELAVEVCEDVGDVRVASVARLNIATLTSLSGDPSASRGFEEVLPFFIDSRMRPFEAYGRARFAQHLRRIGELEAAGQQLEATGAFIDGVEDLHTTCFHHCERVHLALALGESHDSALTEVERLQPQVEAGPQSDVGGALARLRRAVGAFERGEPLHHGEHPSDIPPFPTDKPQEHP